MEEATKPKGLSSIEIGPVSLVLVYISGFIIINTHLSKYNIYEISALNFNYLKAGAVFVATNSIILVIANFITKDKFKLSTLFEILLYIAIISNVYGTLFYLRDSSILNHYPHNTLEFISTNALPISGIVSIAFFIFISIAEKDYFILTALTLLFSLINIVQIFKNEYQFTLIYTAIALPVLYATIMEIKSTASDKDDSILSSTPIVIGSLTILCLLFGRLIYDEIPVYVGGGKPYKTKLYISESEKENLLKSKIIENNNTLNQPLEVLYVTEKNTFVSKDNKIICIPSDQIKGFQY